MTQSATYSPTDLLDSWLEARRWSNAHSDLADHFARRSRALQASFAIDLDAPPSDKQWLALLFEEAVASLESIRGPFTGYLEVATAAIDAYRPHQPVIEEATRSLEAGYRALLLDLIEQIWGLDASRAVSSGDVRAHGFDPAAPGPDPVDYI